MTRRLPREKLEQQGLQTLTDVDLVTVLLGSGVDGTSVVDVAKDVCVFIRRRANTDDKTEAILSWHDLLAIKGMGRVKSMQVVCALELGRRLFAQEQEKIVIRGRADVVSRMSHLKHQNQEHVVVLALNGRNELLAKKTIAIGSLNKTIVEPRDVLGWALSCHAAGFILVHNHPSGNTDESQADRSFTERMRKAGNIVGIELIDHVVV